MTLLTLKYLKYIISLRHPYEYLMNPEYSLEDFMNYTIVQRKHFPIVTTKIPSAFAVIYILPETNLYWLLKQFLIYLKPYVLTFMQIVILIFGLLINKLHDARIPDRRKFPFHRCQPTRKTTVE